VNAFHTVCTNGIVHLVWSMLGFISFTLVHLNTNCTHTICGCVTTNIRRHKDLALLNMMPNDFFMVLKHMGRDSVVSIATRCSGLGNESMLG